MRQEIEEYKRLNLASQPKVENFEKGCEQATAEQPSHSLFRPDVLAAVQGMSSESRVVKALAVVPWGTEELRVESVLGQRANKTGTDVRKPLSPEKIERIRDEVRKYMAIYIYINHCRRQFVSQHMTVVLFNV